ncbi:MAG: hypothetical protein KDD48_01715 [Bdellovibrionales bacterium]|nr:hypothetical protein [Bdellovibrionales bacterium]
MLKKECAVNYLALLVGVLTAFGYRQSLAECSNGFFSVQYVIKHEMTRPLDWHPLSMRFRKLILKYNIAGWYIDSIDTKGIWDNDSDNGINTIIGNIKTEGSILNSPLTFSMNFEKLSQKRYPLTNQKDLERAFIDHWYSYLNLYEKEEFLNARSKNNIVIESPYFCTEYPHVEIREDNQSFYLQGADDKHGVYDTPGEFDENKYDDNAGTCTYTLHLCVTTIRP